MSNKITITDFLIKLGFDASEVKKGVKTLEKEFAPLNKKLTADAVKQTKQQKVKNNELKIENRLTAKRLALQKNIDKLKAAGMTTEARSLTGSLRGKNIDKLEAARVRSAKLLHDAEKGIAATKAKAAKVTAREMAERKANAESVRRNNAAMAAQARVAKSTARANRTKQSAEDAIGGRRIDFESGLIKGSRQLNTPSVNPEQAARVRELRKEFALLSERGKIAKTTKEFKMLRREYDDLIHRTKLVTKVNTNLRKDMKASEFAAKSLKSSIGNLSRSYLSVFAAIGATVSFVQTGQELTALKATLLGVSGTSQGAAEDFDFVSKTAKRLGVDLTEATSAYGKLGAAAKSAGLDNDEARNAFLAATEVSTAFNLSTADFEGVSRAMSQILSKGKLSTEELLQLGERVPIAFSSAAKALGVSTKELFKQIESGAIQSVDFLPDFADEVRAYVRETGMLEASLRTSRVAMNRFVTDYKLNVAGAFAGREGGDGGLDSGLAEMFAGLSSVMEELEPIFTTFGDVLGWVLKVVTPLLSMLWQLVRVITVPLVGAFNLMQKAVDKPLSEMNALEFALRNVWEALKLIASAAVYPFAKLQEGLNWLDEWFSKEAKIDIMAAKTSAAIGSPANINSASPSTSTGNTTNAMQQTNTFNIEGAKDTEAVGTEIERILSQQWSANMALGG